MNRLARGLILTWTAVVGSCGPADLPTGTTVEVEENHNGSLVGLTRGQILLVSLESNPTTGYTWEVEDMDVSMLNQMGEPEFQPESSAIGAGGTQTFRFQAVAAGQTVLLLEYRRPWEQGVAPLKTFTLTVLIR